MSKASAQVDPAGADQSLKRVSDVLAPLDHGQKLQLYKLIRDGHLDDMAEPIAQMLVQMLNGRRSEHARRLWTNWFEALIVRDDSTLKGKVRLAGCLHLVDVSAWWFALSSRMEPQVHRVQEAVALRSKDQPLNEIFASEDAYGWANELRLRSLAVLARLRSTPNEATQLLAEVSGFRAQLLKSYGVRQRQGVSRADLDLLETALEGAPAWYGCSAAALHRGDPVREARLQVERGDCPRTGAALFALAGLHRRDDPALAGRLHQAFPLPIVRDAIFGRLLFAAEALQNMLHSSFLGAPGGAAGESGEDSVMRLKHFLAWYDLVQTLELDAADRERNLVRQVLREVSNTIHEEVVPVLSRRLTGLTAHSGPGLLIERVRFVNEFIRLLARRGIVSSGKPWRPEEGGHVASVFRQVAAMGSSEGMKTLSQLAELSEMLGFPVEITALDMALIGVVDAALRERRAFDATEARLIDRVIAVSNDERRRCKWWVTPEVVNLLEAAEKSGIVTGAKRPSDHIAVQNGQS